MIPTRFSALVLLLFALGGLGCSHMEALRDAHHLERKMRVDRLRHFEKIADAYFLIGLEYYKLAKNAQKAGDQEKAAEYAGRSKFYNLFYRDLKEMTETMRLEMGRQNGSSRNVQPRDTAHSRWE